MLESLFNKVSGLKTCNFIKKDSNKGVFLWIYTRFFFFFSKFIVIRVFVKNSIFALQILEKQLHAFAWPILHKSRQTFSYMWKFTWEKDIGERKVHSPVKLYNFYQYYQRFTVLHPPKIMHEMLSSYEYRLQEKCIAPYFT